MGVFEGLHYNEHETWRFHYERFEGLHYKEYTDPKVAIYKSWPHDTLTHMLDSSFTWNSLRARISDRWLTLQQYAYWSMLVQQIQNINKDLELGWCKSFLLDQRIRWCTKPYKNLSFSSWWLTKVLNVLRHSRYGVSLATL